MNLYEVHLKGNIKNFDPSYVVAESLDLAYKIVLDWLNKNDYGFLEDRELSNITILANEDEYSNYPRLFVSEKIDEKI